MDTLGFNIDLAKFLSHKKYKKRTLKEIVSYLSALGNGSGGVVTFRFNEVQKNAAKSIDSFLRSVEQSYMNTVEKQVATLNLDTRIVSNNVVCTVKKSASFITNHYNLYIPTTTQVVSVPSTEDIRDNILNRQCIDKAVKLGSHHKLFVIRTLCEFTEDKETQFKWLEERTKKRIKLVQRIINNNLTHYVSAFANYNGGHIYYGIEDDGVVAGEKILNEDISEIRKKVEKAIKNMIWPEHIDQPKQGEHWDIFFEPVVDENSKPIPSTYVIVIYIAPCLGGVFTEEPECYEMVEKKVRKMSFTAWKKTILGPVEVNLVSPGHGMRCITWVSTKTKKFCFQAFCILLNCLNNGGDLKEFWNESKKVQQKFPDNIELNLVVLLCKIMAHSRQEHFKTADKLLDEYDKLLLKATEHFMFQVLGLLAHAEVARAKGNFHRVPIFLAGALAKADLLSPGLVSALVYLFAGTIMEIFDEIIYLRSLGEFSHQALQHLQQVMLDYPKVAAILENKGRINLAALHLGWRLSGELVDEHIDEGRLSQANSNILAIEQSKCEVTHYREVQLNLVKSIYGFRCSENQPKERMQFLREAFEFSEKGKNLARKCRFFEMVSWTKPLQGLITEKLVHAKLSERRIMQR